MPPKMGTNVSGEAVQGYMPAIMVSRSGESAYGTLFEA